MNMVQITTIIRNGHKVENSHNLLFGLQAIKFDDLVDLFVVEGCSYAEAIIEIENMISSRKLYRTYVSSEDKVYYYLPETSKKLFTYN